MRHGADPGVALAGVLGVPVEDVRVRDGAEWAVLLRIDADPPTRHVYTMISIYGDWRGYQEAVAAFFGEQGCTATVEAQVTGARSTHKIDVYVTFRQHGIECRWVVECKLWKGHVEKENVLTLKGIVEDVGADRGIIFCENGFQSGARDATRHTNILLVTSLEEFKRTVRLNETRTALVYRNSDQQGAPPIYAFPNGDQPQHLLSYAGRVFVANWETGKIAVVDPADKTIESIVNLDKYEVASNSVSATRAGISSPLGPREKDAGTKTWSASDVKNGIGFQPGRAATRL